VLLRPGTHVQEGDQKNNPGPEKGRDLSADKKYHLAGSEVEIGTSTKEEKAENWWGVKTSGKETRVSQKGMSREGGRQSKTRESREQGTNTIRGGEKKSAKWQGAERAFLKGEISDQERDYRTSSRWEKNITTKGAKKGGKKGRVNHGGFGKKKCLCGGGVGLEGKDLDSNRRKRRAL